MKKYDQLHFFIDESGNLAEKAGRDVLLVGGLMVFGSYDDADDAHLRDRLRQNVANLGGRFPNDLHFGDRSGSNLDDRKIESLLRSMSEELDSWSGDERKVYGVHLVHEQDIFTGGAGILAERVRDNRYLSMLWTLVEHLVFVDDKVAERLTSDAKLHLHIANRAFVFDPARTSPESLEALGLHCKPDRYKAGKMVVGRTLTEREVSTMMRMSRRQRWGNSSVELESVNVQSIRYSGNADETPIGLYLADLYLGPIRWLQTGSRRAKRIKSVLVNTFRSLKYGPWMESLARMQTALADSSAEAWLVERTHESAPLHSEGGGVQTLMARQERRVVELLGNDNRELTKVLEDAVQIVDLPGRAAEGLDRAELAGRLLKLSGQDSLLHQVLRLRIQISHANHTGRTKAADEYWQEFLKIEPELHTLGTTGLAQMSAIRNRHAVSLTDRFLHSKATEVLEKIVTERESLRSSLAASFGVPMESLPEQQLGECLGTLGQVWAFIGTPESRAKAIECFRRANGLFRQTRDIERQFIYLGHVACDMGEQGKELWAEVGEHIPELAESNPVFSDGGQFKLALWLKGLLVFSTPDRIVEFATQTDCEQLLNRFDSDMKGHHPFGLIHQCLGMIFAAASRSHGDEKLREAAIEQFRRAEELMSSGGLVLQLLGQTARLRSLLYRWELNPESSSRRKRLSQGVRSFIGFVSEHFSPGGWEEDGTTVTGWFGAVDPGEGNKMSDRAAALTNRVGFNYW